MKGDDIMKNKTLITLYVGIDVSSKINTLCALDCKDNKLIKKTARDSYRLDQVLYEPLNVAILLRNIALKLETFLKNY